ncbi:hypothetical protein NECAME_03588 [Necator americanus]|uniref:Ephrin RBD domain-containing protein n=1 Tax=Necator americanus TaxID=51031 RepID=W2T4Y3_NECAM|nr:hypothetical protein NECAME_03588 [Necator americanus]ETN76022.1 hypothetical protein NECAME_03588 [Necator americanus]
MHDFFPPRPRRDLLSGTSISSLEHPMHGTNTLHNGSTPAERLLLVFDVSNTDHVMPVNIGDRVSLLCPRPGDDYEYSNIYALVVLLTNTANYFATFAVPSSSDHN